MTVCDKANVLRTYAFFRRVFDEVADQYLDIERDYAYVGCLTLGLALVAMCSLLAIVRHTLGSDQVRVDVADSGAAVT